MTTPMTKEALSQRIEKALTDFTKGRASMHVPPLDTDVDVVLAECVDALEAKDKSNAFLKERLAQLANFNPDWDMLEAATDSLREHAAELNAANKRIAELQSRAESAERRLSVLSESHVNLRETMAAIHNTIRLGGVSTSLASIMSNAKRAHEESAAAHGITLQIQGGE